ncbi:DUF726 domain protein [Cordyceps fumosorosea ARSEF 2679]|uniref:DUF726 domain protein n=1 Tax=Cordyceps fumosorosea (strain ARSEF 2679) TaxID=1081104 RepID=A0A168BRX8_CORFA|nr:DUF726 domain protein [Cordyceps fumosorosea ARSEF 2679]OAA70470.1 DUF726 domain protein [Cordyceps fumosorosea ARSEF 2679]
MQSSYGFVCFRCRALARWPMSQLVSSRHRKATYSTKSSTAHKILARPTWSVRSLLAEDDASPAEAITSAQLHHLLRLSALPLPKSKEEEASMIATLQSQLHFVKAVQRVDTTGLEPLQAIRDETEEGWKEGTIGLGDLKQVLAKEVRVGHYKRPRRVKEKIESEAENWDALSTASKKAGKYFVVESAKKP